MQPFKLERYFAQHEFSAEVLMSSSDCESLSLETLLNLCDPETEHLWKNLSLGYTESQGLPLLRAEISTLYTRLHPDQVITLAPEEGIYIAMRNLLRPGDHVICLAPAYQSLYQVAADSGCSVSPCWLRPSPSGWQLDPQQIKDLIRPNTRMLVVNFPHNPSGFLPSRALFEQIIDLAAQHNLILFSDEMYRLLEYQTEDRLPAACDAYPNAVSLGGLSKSMSLPGLRAGWLAAQNREWIQSFQRYKDYTTICSSAPSEVLAVIALRAREEIVQTNLGIIRANTALAQAFFARNAAWFEWIPPLAGPIALPRYTGPGSVDEFCLSVLQQQNVMIVPGSMFELEGDYFRVGLGRKNLPEALRRLQAYLDAAA
ncbi:MAG: aminotransferase class I/II-fold pyridoxal phosphate-dependent enzyme [Chloroflexi bacterium]|nr:aminotransferase class I/II-fold pyridoxal phosphate-dependent enzyme [Chloroflexota bacterium]